MRADGGAGTAHAASRSANRAALTRAAPLECARPYRSRPGLSGLIVKASNLTLYELEGCPYCARVLACMARLRLDIERRDIRAEPRYREELIEATGIGMVPCLRIDRGEGKLQWLHESLDIVAFLEQHFPARGGAAG